MLCKHATPLLLDATLDFLPFASVSSHCATEKVGGPTQI